MLSKSITIQIKFCTHFLFFTTKKIDSACGQAGKIVLTLKSALYGRAKLL